LNPSVGWLSRSDSLRPLSVLLLEMAAAMWKYNFNEGIYAVREYELPLILGLASLALAATGAGMFSLDHLIFRKKDKHVIVPAESGNP
jgi:hypothetical protein